MKRLRRPFIALIVVVALLAGLSALAWALGLSTGWLENFTGGSLSFTISGGKLMLSRPMTLTNLVGERLGIDLGSLIGNRPASSSQEAPVADAKKDTPADAPQTTPAPSEPARPDPVGIITDIFNRRRR